jgi:hypothetical protein
MPPTAPKSKASVAQEAAGVEADACARAAAPAAQAGAARRVAWLLACVPAGAAIGAAGRWLTDNEWWYLAVPVLLALAWWQVADPTCCNRAARPGD